MGLSKPIQQLETELAEGSGQFAGHDPAIGLCLNEVLRSFVAGNTCHGRNPVCQFHGEVWPKLPRQALPSRGKALISRLNAILISINPGWAIQHIRSAKLKAIAERIQADEPDRRPQALAKMRRQHHLCSIEIWPDD
jgi:hypothetical protein